MSDAPPIGEGQEPAPGARHPAAFFDLDKTIIAKAAMAAFRGPLHDGGLLSRRAVARAVLAHVIYLYLGASEGRIERLGGKVMKLAEGWDRTTVQSIVDEALERIVDPIIYAEAMDLIDQHHRLGHVVVIVSASPSEIVEPLGRHLGADATISTQAEVDADGRYTGRIAFYAYGSDKAAAVLRFADENGVDLASSYAYSDSNSDVPMLEAVGHPVVVNGDRTLARMAREHQWDTLTFASPVRLRDRMRDRSRSAPPRSAGRLPAAIGAVATGAVAVTWWIGGRLRRSRHRGGSPS